MYTPAYREQTTTGHCQKPGRSLRQLPAGSCRRKLTYGTQSLQLQAVSNHFYFAGKHVAERTGTGSYTSVAAPDRLGSEMSYFPYGDEKGTVTAQERVKFATYWRDGESGLDYAMNRYYSSVMGRFLSADPYMSSGGLANPQGWNRYSYVQGDPINNNDGPGLYAQGVGAGLGGGGAAWGWDPYVVLPENACFAAFYSLTNSYAAPVAQSVLQHCIQAQMYWAGHGGPGGGGAEAKSPLKNPIPGEQAAYDALGKPECVAGLKQIGASHARGTEAAQGVLQSAGVNYGTSDTGHLIPLVVKDVGSGYQVVNGASLAESNSTSITINKYINWYFPDKTIATLAGTADAVVYNWQEALSGLVGATLSLTEAQALVILHEVAHILGAPQEDESNYEQFNTTIYKNCL
jgi:RHS repeat-associated protein